MNRIFATISLMLLFFGCAQKQVEAENCQNLSDATIPKEWLIDKVTQSEIEQHIINKTGDSCKDETLKNYLASLEGGGISWSFSSV